MLALCLLAGGASLLSPSRASAQTLEPVVLTQVTVTDSAADETRVLLTFNQSIPQFSLPTTDDLRPQIGFAATVRGSGAVVPPGAHGGLQGIEFQQHGTNLVLMLTGTGPLHVTSLPQRGNAILLVVKETHKRSSFEPQDRGQAPSTAAGPLPNYLGPKDNDELFEVIALRYADVSEIVGLLSAGAPLKPNDNFVPQEPAFGSQGITGGNSGNNLAMPNLSQLNAEPSPYGQQVDDTIGIDRRLNAIILRGPAARIAPLRARIAQLDVPVTSVLLETVFVELTETGARNVGLDFKNAGGKIAVSTFASGAYAPGGGLGNNGLSGEGLSSVSLQAAIYAEVQKGEGRILSRPRISAQSGASAKIITGDALPILTAIALSGVNAVSQQVQYVNVGVTLQIAPRVSEDGFVTSHIFCEVSSVTGYSQGYPTISQREASTTATVMDGEYFVIGGLTQENKLTSRSQVPVLGDIPGIGELFKLHIGNASKTQLYIVVTPHIVRAGDTVAARAQSEK